MKIRVHFRRGRGGGGGESLWEKKIYVFIFKQHLAYVDAVELGQGSYSIYPRSQTVIGCLPSYSCDELIYFKFFFVDSLRKI